MPTRDSTISNKNADATDSRVPKTNLPQPGVVFLEDVRNTALAQWASGKSPTDYVLALDGHSRLNSLKGDTNGNGSNLPFGDHTRLKEPKWVSEKKNPDGTTTRIRDDGAECTFSSVLKPDGSGAVERLDSIKKTDGTSRTFNYNLIADPTIQTGFVDRTKDASGKFVEDKYVRDGKDFVHTKADGTKERLANVEIVNGQIVYDRPDQGRSYEDVLRKVIGDRSTHSDLESAKADLMAVATKHEMFKGRYKNDPDGSKTREKFINGIEHRLLSNPSKGIKGATADEIAVIFRQFIRMVDTPQSERKGAAAKLSQNTIKRDTEDFMYMCYNPYEGARQEQIGSCYLHAGLAMKLIAGDPRFVTYFADALTNSSVRGMRFNSTDLAGGVGGQNGANHIACTMIFKASDHRNASRMHVTSGYPGTGTGQMNESMMYLFGHKMPVFTLGRKISEALLKKAAMKYGGAGTITMNGQHAQLTTPDPRANKDRWLLCNWWYPRDEKVLSRGQLFA